MMATTKGQVTDALRPGDSLGALVCYWQPLIGDRVWDDECWGPIQKTSGIELPEREFHSGYGGVDGERVICFSDRYVYIKVQYDGSEWVEAIPRSPESLLAYGSIPEAVGGG